MFTKDILMIDDSRDFCETITELIIEEEDYTIDSVFSGQSGIEKLEKNTYRIILLDLKMPGMSGLEVLTKMEEKKLIDANYVIVLTGEITIENAVSSLQYGARDFIQKPFVAEYPEQFLNRLKKGLAWQTERLLNEELKKERKKAVKESQLIVKSVGHDMSGSYYGSVMLRLQMLNKKLQKISEGFSSENLADFLSNAEGEPGQTLLKLKGFTDDSLEKCESVIELMKFFKELGEKLKHLGHAISIDKAYEKEIDLNGILHSAVKVFADSAVHGRVNVSIMENYYAEPLFILASEEDLLRVFLNLVENAFKAMEGNGTLSLVTEKKAGKAIAKITDTGCGIPEDKLEDIWRPDYTSWKNTTGTGLGLLICRKAVENWGGEILVDSKLDIGTTFTLKFDLVKK